MCAESGPEIDSVEVQDQESYDDLDDDPDDERGDEIQPWWKEYDREDENHPGDDHYSKSFRVCQYRGLAGIKINQQECAYSDYRERADKCGEQTFGVIREIGDRTRNEPTEQEVEEIFRYHSVKLLLVISITIKSNCLLCGQDET